MLSVVHGFPPLLWAIVLLVSPDPAPPAPVVEAPAPPPVIVEAGPAWTLVAASPLPAGYHVASDFGYRPSRRTGRRRFHAGIDFHAERGAPVFAVRRGVVETVAHNRSGHFFRGYGNAVVLRHQDDARWSFYAHLDEVLVEPGQVVEPGELIGRVGNTTNRQFPGMGTHLHFEVRVALPDGTSPFPGAYRRHNVDPEAWLGSIGLSLPQEPVAELGERPILVFTQR